LKDTNNISTNLTIFVPANGKNIALLSQQLNLLPFISGVSSADSDFNLVFGDPETTTYYESSTQKLHLEVAISEFH
jgi:hypothetical protein